MYQLATEIRGIGGVIKGSFQLYKKSFKKIFFLPLLVGVLYFIAIFLAMPGGQFNANSISSIIQQGQKLETVAQQSNKNTSIVKSQTTIQAPQKASSAQHVQGVSGKKQVVQKQPRFSWISSLFMIVFVLFLIQFGLMMFRMMGEISRGNEVSYKSAARYSLRKYFIFLAAAVTIGVMLTIIYVSLLLTIFLAILVPFVLMFCIVLFKFILPGIILDDKGVFSSIGYSARLVWGNWWRTFVVLLVPGLFFGLVMLVSFLFVFLPGVFHAGPVVYWIIVPVGIILYLVTLIFMFIPWYTAVILEQYQDLKLRYNHKLDKLREKLSQGQQQASM